MDSFEINKIIAAILIVIILVISIDKVSDIIFHVEKPKTPGYAVDIEQAVTTSTETAEEKIDIAAFMIMGDVATGEKIFKKCNKYNLLDKNLFLKIKLPNFMRICRDKFFMVLEFY